MYERVVAVPRLVADLKPPSRPSIVEAIRGALGERYRTDFPRVTAALYRDGRDSVAWHGDQVARRLPEALVATVSLGCARRFLLRPTPDTPLPRAEPTTTLWLGAGDLLVMGGSCQRTYQHAIPKVSQAGPRIALMFRPVWVEPRPDGTDV